MKFLKSTTFLSFLLLFSAFTLSAQLDFNWALTLGGAGSELTGNCRLDDQGNIYNTVIYRDTADLNPGPGVDMAFVQENEVFVLHKFNELGEYQWGGQFKTKGHAAGQIVEVRNNRILLIVYYTDSIFYIHPTPWMAATPGPNIAAISMNLDGQIISFRHIANTNRLYFSAFLTQEDGSILASGGFGESVQFNTPDSTKTYVPVGKDDAFIARFNDQIELEWLTLFAGKGDDFAISLFPGEEDKIYFAVIHDSTIVVPTNAGDVAFPANGEDNSIFGFAFPNGTIEAAYSLGGDLGDQIRNIVADTDGNMYINGYYTGEVNFQHPSQPPVVFTDEEEGEGFIAKYAPDGILDWVRIFTNGEYGGVYTMKIHRNAHLYFSGGFNLISDLDPGPDSMIVDGGYRGGLMAGKMSTTGDLVWVHSLLGEGFSGIRSFLPGTDEKVYIYGYYYESLDCDPGPDTVGITTLTGADAFLISCTEENVITSIPEANRFDLSVSPNPSSGDFEIKSASAIENISVYTLNGQLVSVPVQYNNLSATVGTQILQSGIYVAQIKTADGFSVLKLCKQ